MKDISKKDQRNNIPLVSRKSASQKTIINIRGFKIGWPEFIVMAGPCTVESEEQLENVAQNIKKCGAQILRGGAYKPLTFPYRNSRTYELREKGLKIINAVKKNENIPVVTEVLDVRNVYKVARVADILQIGARNMQNFPLLEEVAKTKKDILEQVLEIGLELPNIFYIMEIQMLFFVNAALWLLTRIIPIHGLLLIY